MVFLYIIGVVFIILIIFLFSKIQIKIENFKFTSETIRHINTDYKFVIKLYIFSKIPILKISITKKFLERLKLKEKMKTFEMDFIENKLKVDKDILKAMKKLDVNIKKLNLRIDLGTENASFTSILIPILSTVISMLLRNRIKDYKSQHYIINPIFTNQNLINIELSSIFEIKMIHIIDSIYVLNKKEGVDKYERTSNRRAYDNCYE